MKKFILKTMRKVIYILYRTFRFASNRFLYAHNVLAKGISGVQLIQPNSACIPAKHLLEREFPQRKKIFPALPKAGSRPSVTVFGFFNSDSFFGGIATLVIISAILARKLNYRLRFISTAGGAIDKSMLVEFLNSNNIIVDEGQVSTIDMSARSTLLELHPQDIILASAWWDAEIASALPIKKFVYLIQDYEPIFYPNGDEYIFAENTYKIDNFIPLVNTSTLLKFFASNNYTFASKAISFEPAISPGVVADSNTYHTKKRIFLYGRPSVARNLYFSTIDALDDALSDVGATDHDFEVITAGENNISQIKLSCGITVENLGKMSADEYFEFVKTVDVAITPMMAPHPNYPTLEFAKLGIPVVTTRWETKYDLSNYSPNILMSDLSIGSLRKNIIKALNMANISSGINIESDWEKSLNDPITKIIEEIKNV